MEIKWSRRKGRIHEKEKAKDGCKMEEEGIQKKSKMKDEGEVKTIKLLHAASLPVMLGDASLHLERLDA
jgi:hypothetical protein